MEFDRAQLEEVPGTAARGVEYVIERQDETIRALAGLLERVVAMEEKMDKMIAWANAAQARLNAGF